MLSAHFFTSITGNYIPKARVLAASVKRFHPDSQFHLVLSDKITPSVNVEEENFDSIIAIEELGIPQLRSWIFKHTLVEMCTGVKGVAFQTIMRRYNAQRIIYLDPDIVVLNPLDELLEQLNHHSILLTPHQTVPETQTDAIVDNEICSLRHGVYNLGFLATNNSPQAKQFLQWWSSRLIEFCYDNIPGGLFTDQRWIDLAPAFFNDIHILRDPVYNVATWNLTHRLVTGSLEDIRVENQPLGFYHFSGFDSGAQEIMLKKYGFSSPVLFQLRKWYIEQCRQMGQDELGKIPCVYSTYENGELITIQQRLLYRQRVDLQQAFPNPFYVSDKFDTNKSYLHWFMAHGESEWVEQLYNYSDPKSAIAQASQEILHLKATIAGMESSKFWRLRNLWFRLKGFPQHLSSRFSPKLNSVAPITHTGNSKG